MTENEDVFKRSASGHDKFEESVAIIKKEIEERNERLKEIADKLKDPVYLAGMMLAVQTEKENTNRILKNIYAELERVKGLEERVKKLEELKGKAAEMPALPEDAMLPEVDEKIVGFIKRKGKACAAEVQREFKYKGKNAASARLNRLYGLGVLNKTHAGRKVYYFLRS